MWVLGIQPGPLEGVVNALNCCATYLSRKLIDFYVTGMCVCVHKKERERQRRSERQILTGEGFLAKMARRELWESSGILCTTSVDPRNPNEIAAPREESKGSAWPPLSQASWERGCQASTKRKKIKEPPFLQSHKDSQGSCTRWEVICPWLPGKAFF